eukprot:2785975-Pleurochrysis_carterae.AAC.2
MRPSVRPSVRPCACTLARICVRLSARACVCLRASESNCECKCTRASLPMHACLNQTCARAACKRVLVTTPPLQEKRLVRAARTLGLRSLRCPHTSHACCVPRRAQVQAEAVHGVGLGLLLHDAPRALAGNPRAGHAADVSGFLCVRMITLAHAFDLDEYKHVAFVTSSCEVQVEIVATQGASQSLGYAHTCA